MDEFAAEDIKPILFNQIPHSEWLFSMSETVSTSNDAKKKENVSFIMLDDSLLNLKILKVWVNKLRPKSKTHLFTTPENLKKFVIDRGGNKRQQVFGFFLGY